MYIQIHTHLSLAAQGANNLTAADNRAIPLVVLLVPILFALTNVALAYTGAARFKKLRSVAQQHEWLLQQKNNSLAMIQTKIGVPLESIEELVKRLYSEEKLNTENRKKLLEAVGVSRSRVENLTRELQRTTLSLTHEAVDSSPFYKSATMWIIVGTTAFILVILNAILISTETLMLTWTSALAQFCAFMLVALAVLLTNRYKKISDKLLAHSKATLKLQQSVDDAKDHIISLVVKILSADIEKLKSDIALFIPAESQPEVQTQIQRIDSVIARLDLLNNIESRLIKSDVKLLNVEELVEEVFKSFQPELNKKGIQVEHFHRVGASRMQLGIVQDRALLKTALAEVFKNAVAHAPESSVIKILSEHSLTNSSITVADQGSGEPFAHTVTHPMSGQNIATDDSIGIGLYLADQILHILGGDIMVVNTPGVGSNVKLSFINNYVR